MRGHAVAVDNWAHAPEDAHLLDAERGVACVFDGLAGHGDGDVASALARDTISELVAEVEPGWALRAAETARARLLAHREKSPNPRMTCTAVIASVHAGQLEVVWCGDSRAYELTGDGRLVRLTRDHDFLYEKERDGLIGSYRAEFLRLAVDDVQTQSDAFRAGGAIAKKAYRQRHVMASELALGPLDTLTRPWPTDSVLVLTTDGVHDNLTRTQMQEVAREYAGDPRGCAAALVEAAESRARAGEGDAHPDDITCVTLAC